MSILLPDLKSRRQTSKLTVQQIVGKLKKSNPLHEVEETLKSYQVYLNNIIKYPTDQSFRKISLFNLGYQLRFGHVIGSELRKQKI